MTIANIITIIRILFVPVFIYFLLIVQNFTLSGIIFVLTIFTDLIDGFVARYLEFKTELGSFLDPLADKLLIVSAYIILFILEKIPNWLFIVVIGRDFILIFGWFIIYIFSGSSKLRVRFLGKITIFLHTITITLVLFGISLNFVFYTTAIVTFFSLVDYLVKGAKFIVPVK